MRKRSAYSVKKKYAIYHEIRIVSCIEIPDYISRHKTVLIVRIENDFIWLQQRFESWNFSKTFELFPYYKFRHTGERLHTDGHRRVTSISYVFLARQLMRNDTSFIHVELG